MPYTTEQVLAEARRTFPFTELWRILRLQHQPRINFVMPCPYRPLATEMDFLPVDPFHWRDLRTGETGDAFGEDPDDSGAIFFLTREERRAATFRRWPHRAQIPGWQSTSRG